MDLEINHEGSTLAQLAAARRAALDVFSQHDIDPYDAWLAQGEECEWVEAGCPAHEIPEGSNGAVCQVIVDARAAAARALGTPAAGVTLDFLQA